jgi:hypothetical protein
MVAGWGLSDLPLCTSSCRIPLLHHSSFMRRPGCSSTCPNDCEWLFLWRHGRVYTFHSGGPRVKHHITRPILDVVVPENLIGSLT